MGIYRRGPFFWISYAGPTGEIVRESTRQSDSRVAERLFQQRKREVGLGAWKPLGEVERPTVAEYAPRWIAKLEARGVRTVHDYHARTRDHVIPLIGERRLCDLRPLHVHAFVLALASRELAPRSQRHVYDCLRSLCRSAVVDEVIAATPCVLEPGVLVGVKDADPAWRAGAIYDQGELELLISDERIPEDRRVLYAIQALTGMRFGETAGRRWRDVEQRKPLGRLLVATQYDDRETKTGVTREVPIHPTLAAILAEWKSGGWQRMVGRAPTRDDLIIPSRRGRVRSVRLGHTRLVEDLERLKLRARRQHDLRRSFISLARAGGANKDVLRHITHGDPKAVMDLYTTWPWETLCAAVVCLELRRGAQSTAHEMAPSENRPSFTNDSKRGGRDLNARKNSRAR